MKKITKAISVILCVIMVFMSLSSCSKSIEKEIIDVWGGEVGSSLVILEILENGKCNMVFMDKYDGDLESHNGTWEIDGKKVTCEMKKSSGGSLTFEFTYKDGELVSQNVVLVRQNMD